MQMRARVHDAGLAHAPDQVAAVHGFAFVQIGANGIEMDVARDHGAVLVAHANVAASAAAAARVALDALDDAFLRSEYRLAERRAEIDAAVAELALARARWRT